MVMIENYNFSDKPIVILTVKTMEEQVHISFSEYGEESEIVTINMYYEDRDGENWLNHFTVNESVTTITDRTDVADEVLNNLTKEIPQESVAQGICEFIDNIVDEMMSKHKINEED